MCVSANIIPIFTSRLLARKLVSWISWKENKIGIGIRIKG